MWKITEYNYLDIDTFFGISLNTTEFNYGSIRQLMTKSNVGSRHKDLHLIVVV